MFKPALAMGIIGLGSMLGQTESCVSDFQTIFQSNVSNTTNGDEDGGGDNDDVISLFEADLVGDMDGSGSVRYEVRDDGTEFRIEIQDGVPGAILDIVIDGVLVDQITLDESGAGEVEYSDAEADDSDDDSDSDSDSDSDADADDDPDSDESPYPDDFPEIIEGSVVEVGDLSGVMAASVVDSDDDGDAADDDSDDDGDDDDSSDDGSDDASDDDGVDESSDDGADDSTDDDATDESVDDDTSP